MQRLMFPLALIIASVDLAGCDGISLASTAVVTSTPSRFDLPPGAPCSAEIGRYDSVVKDDLATGNVQRKVYDRIQGVMGRAASACLAGKGGEAHGLIAASKARHGYRA